MIKRISLMLFFLCFILSLHAQMIDLNTNGPRCGDIVKRKQIQFFNAGSTGNSVVWDFRDLNIFDKNEETIYFLDQDSILTSANINLICRYSFSGDSLKQLGCENATYYIDYTRPLTLITYPFLYGYYISNNYEGYGMYCQKQRVKIKGEYITGIDAKGSLITVTGDTLENVVRLHSVRTSSWCMYCSNDSLISDSTNTKQEIQETNQWYVRGYRYPLYETVTTSYYDKMSPVSCVQSAYMYVIDDSVIKNDSENEKILEDIKKHKVDEKKIIHYDIQSNDYEMAINYSLDEEANINALLCNVRGMVYGHQANHHKEGTGYQMKFNTASLPKGEYILYLNVNGVVNNEKIQVQK